MTDKLVDKLFRHEAQKMTAALCRIIGFDRLEDAEDIVAETFVKAINTWAVNGTPDNPQGWLYKVAKHKALDYIKHQKVKQTAAAEITNQHYADYSTISQVEVAFSADQIKDSMLAMLFAVCTADISTDYKLTLALKVLCSFSAKEIESALLVNLETVNKRLVRAKEKLREQNIDLQKPITHATAEQTDVVLKTIYLLFNEGYHSASATYSIRQDLCAEAIRLALLLTENPATNLPTVHALLAIMYFHSSRLNARLGSNSNVVLYDDQDRTHWNEDLIAQGNTHLNLAAQGNALSTYHTEAVIAHYHTQPHSPEKWNALLFYYQVLLKQTENPIVALNATYVLYKAKGSAIALTSLKTLTGLENNYLYLTFLATLYAEEGNTALAIENYTKSLNLAPNDATKAIIQQKINNVI